MSPADRPAPLSDFARALVQRRACRLVGRAGFTAQDQTDLEQELATRLLERLAATDHERADREAFLIVVVTRLAANLLRQRRARKRDNRGTVSLERKGDHGTEPLAASISQHEQDTRLARATRATEDQVNLQLDLAAVLAQLPPEDRDLAERLMHHNISQVGQDLGVPRTTLSARVRRLRQHFEQHGLQHYLNREIFPGLLRRPEPEPGCG